MSYELNLALWGLFRLQNSLFLTISIDYVMENVARGKLEAFLQYDTLPHATKDLVNFLIDSLKHGGSIMLWSLQMRNWHATDTLPPRYQYTAFKNDTLPHATNFFYCNFKSIESFLWKWE